VQPEDFLLFAKKDYQENDERGLINCLSNVKRAIDCIIDEVLNIYGIDIENESKSLKNLFPFPLIYLRVAKNWIKEPISYKHSSLKITVLKSLHRSTLSRFR